MRRSRGAMATRAGYLAGGVVALAAVVACVGALVFWGEAVTARRKTTPTAALSVAPLPAASAHAALGKESVELRDLADAQAPLLSGKRPRAVPHRRDELFPPSHSDTPLPRLRNSVLADGHDERTDKLIRALTGPEGRAAFEHALERSGRLRPQLESVLAAWKVPEALVAIVFVESGFNPLAEDGERVGLWGLRPTEATAYGLYVSDKYDERRAVELSTEVAAHHLRDLHDRLGQWELAIAAFGAGYSRVLPIATESAGRPYWALAASGRIPEDVVAYVSEVLAVSLVLTNSDAFHLAIPPSAPLATSDIEVPSATPLSVVAEAANVPLDTLRDLNPEFLADVVPPTDFPMYVHLPSTALARARELLMPILTARTGSSLARPSGQAHAAAANADERLANGEKTFYRTRDGDTLQGVAQRFGLTTERIARDNALSTTSNLRPGMLLVLRRLDTDTVPDASR